MANAIKKEQVTYEDNDISPQPLPLGPPSFLGSLPDSTVKVIHEKDYTSHWFVPHHGKWRELNRGPMESLLLGLQDLVSSDAEYLFMDFVPR
ncbi:hypothetical protein NEUTE1DRAFT_101333 [Neurospora tetrasperma FGSC 2508]|uniref:Uncharacterized protein n=1 Tax=Neurospora tetrasperma (strain FGSC 2508 / ATCC MYA-4615 / P0657) TaxID=510951 RepID=F8MLZ6_NEUT8|nr:uncharacterized protein NEUTE1DRAFT_101333 [Neurospora tetrasperma FGSC 2508]EGO58511.1 hypothetical protein NEUTE1DRAFT_101333 [Neurospora tetrasperma FGSC 2508]EGZ71149.1 hypothetical protein NEUTE2DRAFT_65736 [Neurospora tetrasperma FGSC 2509]